LDIHYLLLYPKISIPYGNLFGTPFFYLYLLHLTLLTKICPNPIEVALNDSRVVQ